jgi:hypothetical protein
MKVNYLLHYFLTGCGWLLPALWAYAANDVTVEQKLAALAQSAAAEIRLVEEKHSWVLSKPVISEGVLQYDAATATLSKQVLKPEPMSMSISGDQIKITRAQQQRQLRVPRDSPLRDLLLALRALLAGDVAALRRNFIIDYQAQENTWDIRFTPRDPVLTGKLARISVSGSDDQVASIDITLANGDRQLMRLQH